MNGSAHGSDVDAERFAGWLDALRGRSRRLAEVLPDVSGASAALQAAVDIRRPPAGEETVFLGMGGNVGERLRYLDRALRLVMRDSQTTVQDVSSVYETEPIGPSEDPFLNLAIRARTTRSPISLLRLCQDVEGTLGRVRTSTWAPRTIDIDILIYGDRMVTSSVLTLPHARLVERAFALVPLIEVAPGWSLPDGTSLTKAVTALAPITGIDSIGRQIRIEDPYVEPADPAEEPA